LYSEHCRPPIRREASRQEQDRPGDSRTATKNADRPGKSNHNAPAANSRKIGAQRAQRQQPQIARFNSKQQRGWQAGTGKSSTTKHERGLQRSRTGHQREQPPATSRTAPASTATTRVWQAQQQDLKSTAATRALVGNSSRTGLSREQRLATARRQVNSTAAQWQHSSRSAGTTGSPSRWHSTQPDRPQRSAGLDSRKQDVPRARWQQQAASNTV